LFIALRLPNPRITAFTLLIQGLLNTLTLYKLLLRERFWLIIAFSLLFNVTSLIIPFKKPKTIMLRVDFVVFAEALNVVFSAFYFC
jgi:hypothetical protein